VALVCVVLGSTGRDGNVVVVVAVVDGGGPPPKTSVPDPFILR
jgi:hypothetical protein